MMVITILICRMDGTQEELTREVADDWFTPPAESEAQSTENAE
ncbi:MAG: hypothetical protein QMB62_06110 [Oscillospiraceae bacterium]